MADAKKKPPARIAVASKSGIFIDECFGRAVEYLIYEWKDGEYGLAEKRAGPAPCRDGSHDHGQLAGAIAIVKDCDVVLAGRIGPEAVRLLALAGVRALSTRIAIEDALTRLAGKPLVRLSRAGD